MASKNRDTREAVSAAEVLRRLAEMELEGVQFYEGMHRGTRSEWVRRLASVLIEAEKRHNRRFTEYAERAEQSVNPDDNALTEPLPPDVHRLFTACVFVSKQRIRDAAQYANDVDMIKLAIRAEENLALLLTQLHSYVP